MSKKTGMKSLHEAVLTHPDMKPGEVGSLFNDEISVASLDRVTVPVNEVYIHRGGAVVRVEQKDDDLVIRLRILSSIEDLVGKAKDEYLGKEFRLESEGMRYADLP